MISLPLLILFGVLQTFTFEYVIDFGATAQPFAYNFVIVLSAEDGSALKIPTGQGKDADPNGLPDAMRFCLNDNGWESRLGQGATLIVTGTKKGSPVKSVSVSSEAKVPTVRWILIAPKPPTKSKK